MLLLPISFSTSLTKSRDISCEFKPHMSAPVDYGAMNEALDSPRS